MSDSTTTVVPVARIVADVISGDLSSYQAATPGDKTRTRTALNSALVDAMTSGSMDLGATIAQAIRTVTESGPAAKAPVEVDYRTLLSGRIANLRAAADLLESGHVRPEGFPVGVEVADLPVVEFDTEVSSKIASAKISRVTMRNSIEAVIERAFDGLQSGDFLTVAQIRKAGTTDDYTPGDGAIAARLFPSSGNCTLTTVVPVDATSTHARGARLV
jgi:hypothetical protein